MKRQELLSKVSAICIMHGGDAIQAVHVSVSVIDHDPQGKENADCSHTMYAAGYQYKGRWASTGSFTDPEELFDELHAVLERDMVLSAPKKIIPMVAGNEAFQRFTQNFNQAS